MKIMNQATKILVAVSLCMMGCLPVLASGKSKMNETQHHNSYGMVEVTDDNQLFEQTMPHVILTATTLANQDDLHGVRFSWKWNKTPVFSKLPLQEHIRIRWLACDQNAYIIKTLISSVEVNVNYNNTTQNVSWTFNAEENCIEADFSSVGNGWALDFAKSGSVDFYFTTVGQASNMVSSVFDFEYGHEVVGFGGFKYHFPYTFGISLDAEEVKTIFNWSIETQI